MSTELDTTVRQPDDDAALMITAAIDKGIGPEGIQALVGAYLTMQDRQAERAFTTALVAFHGDCPPILKTDEGVHKSKYAPLDKMKDAIDPVLRKHGFFATWDTQIHEEKKRMTSTCTLRHIGGHKETSTVTMPIDPAPGMKDMHAALSAITLGERYSLQAVLGIAPKRVDDDGKRAAGLVPITPEEVATLRALLIETGSDAPAFWSYIGVKKLEELPSSSYRMVHQALMQKRKTPSPAPPQKQPGEA